MPTLDAANISFNLLKVAAGDNLTVGPILLGAAKPVNVLTPTATVRRIVNMTALTVVDANSWRCRATHKHPCPTNPGAAQHLVGQ
jgi:malate dehydrogenase (oxaloacetate-decarboxylating)(NADP+)